MHQPYDIHEDWIEFFNKDSTPTVKQERYHEYILRRLKEEREDATDK